MPDVNISNPLSDVLSFGGKVLDKLFPDKNEAEKNKLALLALAQDGGLNELQQALSDIAGARSLAAQDIAGGNNITRFMSATVRPVAGYLAIVAVAHSAITGVDLTPLVKDVVETIIEFYFGGRAIEKITPHVAAAFASFGGK